MVGTRSRADARRATLAALANLTLALACAAAPAAAAEAESGAPRSTERALIFSLERQDLGALAQGLREVLPSPIVGRHDEPLVERYWFATIGVHGISYSFRVNALRVVPEAGRLHVDVRIADLAVNVERMTFNESGSMHCDDMPISSGGWTVPVSADAYPWIEDRSLQLAMADTSVGLDDDNFQIGLPAACDTIWGFNWMVRRVVPWIASMVRDRIAEGVQTALAQAVKDTASSLNDYLQVSITLPFHIEPAPAFYATLSAWPAGITVTRDRLQMVVGADVDMDPDAVPEQRHSDLERLFAVGGVHPSFVGLGHGLLQALMAEANAEGLFAYDVNTQTVPVAAPYLTAETLAGVLPDAGTRFAPTQQLALDLGRARDAEVRLVPEGAGRIPLVELSLTGLPLTATVDGTPYYHTDVDATVGMAFGFDASTRQLRMTFDSVQARLGGGRFDDGLQPAPAGGESPDQAALDRVLAALTERVRRDLVPVVAIDLPDLAVGSRTLELLGSSVRDDYVTVDAVVR